MPRSVEGVGIGPFAERFFAVKKEELQSDIIVGDAPGKNGGQVQHHRTGHRRVRGADKLALGVEFRVVVARDNQLSGGFGVEGCDDIREQPTGVRSWWLVFKAIQLNCVAKAFHR